MLLLSYQTHCKFRLVINCSGSIPYPSLIKKTEILSKNTTRAVDIYTPLKSNFLKPCNIRSTDQCNIKHCHGS